MDDVMGKRKSAQDSNADGALTREQVLAAAEDVFRRSGPAKTTVLDVAKVLGMSHGNVYRHFKSKVALRNAVIEVWLQRYANALEEIVNGPGTAQAKLRQWMDTLRSLKTTRYKEETKLFATYHDLVRDSSEVAVNFRAVLAGQIETMLRAGMASAEFRISDPRAKARAIVDATVRFHHPWHATDWQQDDVDEAFQGVWDIIMGDILVKKKCPPAGN
jgi:AcrR family transcriptional regulator